MKLAKGVHADGLNQSTQLRFGGYNALGTEGEICDMENMSSDHWPELSSRAGRVHIDDVEADEVQGIWACERLYIAADDTLYSYDTDGTAESVNLLENGGQRSFAKIGDYVTVWPDKLAVDTTDWSVRSLDHKISSAAGFFDSHTGQYSTTNNCITLPKSYTPYDTEFHVGDAVTISGMDLYPENNGTRIIREIIENSGNWQLYFDDYSFRLHNHVSITLSEGITAGDYYIDIGAVDYGMIMRGLPALTVSDNIMVKLREAASTTGYKYEDIDGVYLPTKDQWIEFDQAAKNQQQGDLDPGVTVLPGTGSRSTWRESSWRFTFDIERAVPDLGNVFQHSNRLFGTEGDTIWVCRWGDPFNWNYFDGTSADSWATETGTPGQFTGAIAYSGYPRFFKEDHIFTLYGDYPGEYQLVTNRSIGVMPGSSKSLAIGDGRLFFLSYHGPCVYSGGEPALLSDPFGTERYHGGIGISDDKKYYLLMHDESGAARFFVYDIHKRIWTREDTEDLIGLCMWFGDAIRLTESGSADVVNRPAWTDEAWTQEGPVEWYAEFGDIAYGIPERKKIAKVSLRLELERGTAARVLMRFDSEETWREMGQAAALQKRSVLLPIVPRRTDHFRLRLEGTGDARISSISIETEAGSDRW